MFFDVQLDIQKAPQMIENRSQKHPKWSQHLHLSHIWLLLRRHLGAKLAILTPLGVHLGDLGCHVGPKMLPRTSLGFLSAILGAILAPRCSSHGSQNFSWRNLARHRCPKCSRGPPIFSDSVSIFQRVWEGYVNSFSNA